MPKVHVEELGGVGGMFTGACSARVYYFDVSGRQQCGNGRQIAENCPRGHRYEGKAAMQLEFDAE
jgi:hypothetical protein